MKTKKSAKILIILSIIGLIAFAGCTGKSGNIISKVDMSQPKS